MEGINELIKKLIERRPDAVVEGIKDLIKRTSPAVMEGVNELMKRAAAVAEDSSLIPLIGPFIAVPLSFGGTYFVLKIALDKMEDVAIEVVKFATEKAANVRH